MDVRTKPSIPQQRDRSAELAELSALAAAISEQVDARQRRRDPAAVPNSGKTAEADAAPDTRRGRRTRVVALVMAVVTAAGFTTMLFGESRHPRITTPAAPTHVEEPTPASGPVALGAAAGKRISNGGRPLTVFACDAAYDADARRAPDILGPAAPSARDTYVRACLSDMS